MRLPSIRGTGKLPRYGGGWMHQFGHVYLLQQEFLQRPSADASDWFRAMELWHTARHEGLALNVAHYSNVLAHCAAPESGAPWGAALAVLRQMRRDALRADCGVVALALQCCAREARWAEALRVFGHFAGIGGESGGNGEVQPSQPHEHAGKYSGVGLRMDSVCVAAVIRACVAAGGEEPQRQALCFVAALRDTAAQRRSTGVASVDAATVDAALRDLALLHDVPQPLAQQAISGEPAPAAALEAPAPQQQQEQTQEQQPGEESGDDLLDAVLAPAKSPSETRRHYLSLFEGLVKQQRSP